MQKTALYMRMSTDKQDNSILSQRNVLTDYAARNGLKIMCEYKDEGISGRTAEKRPAFLQMVDDSANDDFEVVLIYDSSRFARNLEESLVYKSALKRNGVQVVSATEPTLDNDTSLITDALLGAMNELYSRKLSKAVMRGMTEKAKTGICQAKTPFGYEKTYQKGIVVPSPKNAPIVAEMFRLYASNEMTINGIARHMNLTHGFIFDCAVVKTFLVSEFYIGNVKWNGVTVKGLQEPIVDVETFAKVQERYNAITYKRAPDSYKHWLSGMVMCAHCGKSMSMMNTRWPAFQCQKKASGRCSQNNRVRSYKVENLVFETIAKLLDGTEQVTLEKIVTRPHHSDEQQILTTAITRLEAKINRAKQLYLDGVETLDEFKQTKQLIQKEITVLDTQLKILNEPTPQAELTAKYINRAQALQVLLQDSNTPTVQKCESVRKLISHISYKRTSDNSDEFFIFYV